ncbi:putative protein OS=Streptomyces aurantiogriseus OX=66870 GN=GCM10010251_57660 PE=4 SV=1 [Streptomyces aurantiogriseus]|uniref:Uncharacterized protein n=1 Tax=Streptomyces aurantiogriseus TaxID=66870 RepID=A0A918CQM6_9ACTN|nr:hypothetical protein GCM10010251_57660 [Streptomyces aurantiogriseus]
MTVTKGCALARGADEGKCERPAQWWIAVLDGLGADHLVTSLERVISAL